MSKKIDVIEEKKRTEFFDPFEWAWSLLGNPQLEAVCPWERIVKDWNEYEAGCFWYEILMAYPRMIKHAPVPFPGAYLNATRWAEILLHHPELCSKVPWNDLERSWNKEARLAWMRLLVRHPRFAKYCHWEMFFSRPDQNNPNEWIELLRQQPQFIERYLQLNQNMDPEDRQELISKSDWAQIIAIRPELLCYAPVRQFGKDEWKCINEKQPHLSRKTFVELPKKMKNDRAVRKEKVVETEYRPLTFADLKFLCCDAFSGDEEPRCFMLRGTPINADQWCNILTAYPEFIGECDLKQLEEHHWKSILSEQPQLAEHCPHREWWTVNIVPWEKSFDPVSVPREKLRDDLIFHPVHAKYCKWSHLSGFDWMNLLSFHPEFISRCNIARLTGNRERIGFADSLLALQPQWAKHFDLAVALMDAGAFLKKHPEYMDACEWGKIDYYGWRHISLSYPELLEHCDFSKFPVLPKSKYEGECALGILNCAWMFGSREVKDREKFHDLICQAVRRNPEYLEKWNLYTTKFMWQSELPSLRRLGNFLAEYPELYPLCRPEWLTSKDLEVEALGDFLKWHPEMIRITDPKKLPVKVWRESLRRYPELAEICTCWNRFSAQDWLCLLGGSSKPYSAEWAKPKPGKREMPFSTVLPNPYSDEEVRIQPHPEFFPECPKRIYKKWTQAFEWRYLLDAGCPVEDLIPAELRTEL